MKIFAFIVSVISLWVLPSCSSTPSADSSVKELARVSNPSQTVDAVTAERATDATVATPTEVYIVPRGKKVEGQAVFRADKTESLHPSWKDDTHLLIEAKTARVFLRTPIVEVKSAPRPLTITVRTAIAEEIK